MQATLYRHVETGETTTQIPIMEMGKYNEIHRWYSTKLKSWDEITEEFYNDQLEVLPPAFTKFIDWSLSAFAVGEPKKHNSEGKWMYSSFVFINNKYYYIWERTIKNLKENFTSKESIIDLMKVFFSI